MSAMMGIRKDGLQGHDMLDSCFYQFVAKYLHMSCGMRVCRLAVEHRLQGRSPLDKQGTSREL